MMLRRLPEVVVGAVITNELGQVFLMKGAKWDDMLIVPGGHVEFGESLEAALVREVKEETGMFVSDIRFVGVDELTTDSRHFVFINYVGVHSGGHVALNHEGSDGRFYDLAGAISERLAAPTRRLLEAVLPQLRNRNGRR